MPKTQGPSMSDEERQMRLADIRAKLQEAIDDPRPSLTAKEVSENLDRLHQQTVKARLRGLSPKQK